MATNLFLSWCHADARAKADLLARLQPNLKILTGVRFQWWEDSHLKIGEPWRSGLIARLAACDFGVLFLSPSFFASDFIRSVELPPFVGRNALKEAMPVGLRPIPLDGTRDLQGIDLLQIFRFEDKFFTELSGAGRDRFAVELASQMRERVLDVIASHP